MIFFFTGLMQVTCAALYFCPSPFTIYFQALTGATSLLSLGYLLFAIGPQKDRPSIIPMNGPAIEKDALLRQGHLKIANVRLGKSSQGIPHLAAAESVTSPGILSKSSSHEIRMILKEHAPFSLGQEEFISMLAAKKTVPKKSGAMNESAIKSSLEKMRQWFPEYLQDSLKEVADSLSGAKRTPENELRSSFALLECFPMLVEQLENPTFYEDLKACIELWLHPKTKPYLNPFLRLFAPFKPLLMNPTFPGRAFLTNYLKLIAFQLLPALLSDSSDRFSEWEKSNATFVKEKAQLAKAFSHLPFELQFHVALAEEQWKLRKEALLKLEYYMGVGYNTAIPYIVKTYHRHFVHGEPVCEELCLTLREMEKTIHKLGKPQPVTFESLETPPHKLEDAIALTPYLNQAWEALWKHISPLIKALLEKDKETKKLGEALISALSTLGTQVQGYFPGHVNGLGDYTTRSYAISGALTALYTDDSTKDLIRRVILKFLCVPKDKESLLYEMLEKVEKDPRFKQAIGLFAFQDIFWLLPFVTFLSSQLSHLKDFVSDHMNGIITFIAQFSEDDQIESHRTSLRLLLNGGLTLFGGPINAIIFHAVPGKSLVINTFYNSSIKAMRENPEHSAEVKSMALLMEHFGLLLIQGLFGSKTKWKQQLKAHLASMEKLTKELYQFDPLTLQGDALQSHLTSCLQSYLK